MFSSTRGDKLEVLSEVPIGLKLLIHRVRQQIASASDLHPFQVFDRGDKLRYTFKKALI
jgi:hypothetical protein